MILVRRLSLKILSTSLLFVGMYSLQAQKMLPGEKKYFELLHEHFNAQNAFNTVGFVEQYFRLAGNNGFNESIFYVEKILQQAGFKKEEKGESDYTLTYRVEKRPLRRPTWEPVDAQLYMEGEDTPLLEFKTNRNMLAIYSASTPEEGIRAEVIYAGKGSDGEVKEKDVQGKIVFAEAQVGRVYGTAVKYGAIGALAYSIPGYNQPEKHRQSISFQGIGYNQTDPSQQKWGILVSYAVKEKLKAALNKGRVFVKVMIKTNIFLSEELTLVANVRGTVKPDERFVYSAHVQEPGANDNASGVGTQAEMARVTAQLVQAGQLKPQRTLTFLWGDEIVSTGRYIRDDSVRAKGIKWGLSLDMVGEDTEKTGGTFLIEKMPDPSAIWTRGNDKHTEWGGGVLAESQLFPHYFNDLLFNRCQHESNATGWQIATNPYEGGSDHTPFLQAKIPGLLMWHFTDVYYHTDGDRLDKVSAAEMKHVGVCALITAYLLADADVKTTTGVIKEITGNALERLNTEYKLSKEVVRNRGDKEKEKHILQTWNNWYVNALTATSEIHLTGTTHVIQKGITKAQKKLKRVTAKYIRKL